VERKPVKILLTGLPGCGKTTSVIRIVGKLDARAVAGFFTEEIREQGVRKGFRWASLDGSSGVLAHVDIRGPKRVGKYGVDVAGFERAIVPILNIRRNSVQLFVIDEIGKMECLSDKFVTAMRRLFSSDRSVLATVARKGSGLISEVKTYPGTRLFNLTQKTRDTITEEVLQLLSFLKKEP
jgi:nucleoside-triphosphatase